jgi:hypothetical protein
MAYTLKYQITRWRLKEETVTRPTAPRHTTWRPCATSRQVTWRSACKADAVPISEQNIPLTLKYSLPKSTTSSNMAYTLKYQIPNYTVSHDGGINTKLSNTRLHHVTQYGGSARRHEKQHGGMRLRRTQLQSPNKPTVHTYIFITRFHRITTGNMASAHNTTLSKMSITRPHDGTTRRPTRSNTRLHSATIVTFTGLYPHP